jgi:cyclic pyranopterin phosphate synthase
MLDPFSRPITYLRISVTDRCDLRCIYCMPAEGVPLKSHADILSYEQIESVAKEAAALGVTKIRLTGGEPLVRRNIEGLVAKLAVIPGLEEVTMTTNGIRLPSLAHALRRAGLGRVNISIDSLDPERYRAVTRGGDVNAALRGVDAALDAGLTPVKINMVILPDTPDSDIEAMRAYCSEKGLALQKITQFSLHDRGDLASRIETERPPKCASCNRLRLTADGVLKPCLFSNGGIPVDFNDIRGSLLRAVAVKPEQGTQCTDRTMVAIGG